MTRLNRLAVVQATLLVAATLAMSGCRSTHTTIVEPVRQEHPDDHHGDRDHPPPPPPPPHRDDHR